MMLGFKVRQCKTQEVASSLNGKSFFDDTEYPSFPTVSRFDGKMIILERTTTNCVFL